MKRYFSIILLCCLFFQSCKKFIEVDPPVTNFTSENVYASDGTAAAVLTGIYTWMNTDMGFGLTTSLFTGLYGDELELFGKTANLAKRYIPYYTNALSSTNMDMDFSRLVYPVVYTVNAAVEGLSASTTLTPAVKAGLLGEAKFMRAFCYFYLVNLYGDVPLAITTNYRENALLARAPVQSVYAQIISDLHDAQTLLSEDYVDASGITPTAERLRPNRSAATALLARASLYAGQYADAAAAATSVIANTALYDTVPLNNVFLKTSKEAIWQLQNVHQNIGTSEADLFILPPGGPTAEEGAPVYLSDQLLNSFEPGDLRVANWVNSVTAGGNRYYYAWKYKQDILPQDIPVKEYSTVLRLAELYLIRAEARAQTGDLAGAANDLNLVRKRAGLPASPAVTKEALLTAILQERKVELFTEWGHRWLDMKRTHTVDAVMNTVTPLKGGVWSSHRALFPFQQDDVRKAPKLVQNPGY